MRSVRCGDCLILRAEPLAVLVSLTYEGAHAVGVAEPAVAALAVVDAGAAVYVVVFRVAPTAAARVDAEAADPAGDVQQLLVAQMAGVRPSDCEGWFRSCGYSC